MARPEGSNQFPEEPQPPKDRFGVITNALEVALSGMNEALTAVSEGKTKEITDPEESTRFLKDVTGVIMIKNDTSNDLAWMQTMEEAGIPRDTIVAVFQRKGHRRKDNENWQQITEGLE